MLASSFSSLLKPTLNPQHRKLSIVMPGEALERAGCTTFSIHCLCCPRQITSPYSSSLPTLFKMQDPIYSQKLTSLTHRSELWERKICHGSCMAQNQEWLCWWGPTANYQTRPDHTHFDSKYGGSMLSDWHSHNFLLNGRIVLWEPTTTHSNQRGPQ